MKHQFVSSENSPFCKGCGHSLVAQNIEKALVSINKFSPLDIIAVSDIGCIGIIDKQLSTHTIHGLHGRSVALAMGIACGIDNPKKKVIVFVGDGGATIGINHLLEAAQKNSNISVLLHNNMLYGMTGGQPSGLTPFGFKTPINPMGNDYSGYDICAILEKTGATFNQRIVGLGDFSRELSDAFLHEGFSFTEIIELCPSYGLKYNPQLKLKELIETKGLKIGRFSASQSKPLFSLPQQKHTQPLISSDDAITGIYQPQLTKHYSIILSGSAGEGVQSAAELFMQAAMLCGLTVTKKGSYPVTVGVGFSTAEIILSPQPFVFTGIEEPDAFIITSLDGLNKVKPSISSTFKGDLFIDKTLEIHLQNAANRVFDFRSLKGARNASLVALCIVLKHKPLFPLEAFCQVIEESKAGNSIDIKALVNELP